MYKKLVALAACTGIMLLLINTGAILFYWYDSMWWFDMPMHTIGGMLVVFVGSAFLWTRIRHLPARELFITLTLFVFVIGLAWEYYEYVVQFYVKSVHLADVADSLSDLICDMLGGSIGALFVIQLKKRYNQ